MKLGIHYLFYFTNVIFSLEWNKYKWTEIGNKGVITLAGVLQRMTTSFKVLK